MRTDFERAGFSIIALTYDSPVLQAAFIEANGIAYPMLSDVAAQSVQALGILNVDYAPGDDHYGIPYPGIFILDASMTILPASILLTSRISSIIFLVILEGTAKE